ncbi:SOS response-associated peptidase [Cohnella herbarum]|uniref:Abasic site processing protein n=1 Tax=Cohnella herbarum TaxID=2728023 RepID=A0A7Z2ZJF0_9BACL|nr:SOS response-associated peptidase [Cohnella herbarum]QJD82146.1 SOS response-associated peptidase [Cohnella herbarum]
MRMCNRYSLTAELSDLTEDFRIDSVHVPYFMRYNIAPTQQVPIIQQIGEERCLNQHRWGLMPYWGKNSINANVDTLGDRQYLRTMLTKKRCVVPCSGFYIWKQEGKSKSAWRAVHRKKATFAMPGIYDVWLDSEKNEFPMCTVITRGSAFDTDHTLPVILDEEAMDLWLDPKETRTEMLQSLLQSLPDADFRTYPVTPFVENIAWETPDCIAEVHSSLSLVKI